MLITASVLSEIAGKKINDNMKSAVAGLKIGGKLVGLHRPHHLAHFLAQTGHESMGWSYDREIWGPTAAQKRYEGRTDLGNTEPGDGSLFRGYTPMQITGRYNTTRFYRWCLTIRDDVPDFTKYPHLMNTDPWEGLAPLWYWDRGKSESLNDSADAGDFIRNTKLINGGTNGLSDRYRYYGRAALVLMGRNASDVGLFQKEMGLTADGIVGPNTYKKMHKQLLTLPDVVFNQEEVNETDNKEADALAFIEELHDLIGQFLAKQKG